MFPWLQMILFTKQLKTCSFLKHTTASIVHDGMNSGNNIGHGNKVALHRAWLVLRQVTHSQSHHLSM